MDNFLESCGATESLRLDIEGPRPGRVRPRVLVHPFALVGRAPAADIPLRHAQVSLRHAYLQIIQGRLACFDLGGRGGIQWADGRPARAGWLDVGRSIGIGPFTLRRVVSGPLSGVNDRQSDAIGVDPLRATVQEQRTTDNGQRATNPANVRWDGGGPDVVLEFPDQGSSALSRWRMSRVVTLVGRAPGCRVRLPDVNVSWYHCSLVRTHDGLWFVDLMSRVGVMVNGTALRYGRLDDGDELHVGPFRVIVRMADRNSYRVSSSRSHRAAPLALPPAPLTTALAISEQSALQEPLETELVELLNAQRGSPALVMLVEQFGRMQQQMIEQFNQSLVLLMQHMGEHYRAQMREEMDALRALADELIALKERLQSDADTPAAVAPSKPGNGHRAPYLEPPQPAPANLSEKLTAPEPTPAEDPLVMVSRRISQIRGEQRSRWQRIMDLVKAR